MPDASGLTVEDIIRAVMTIADPFLPLVFISFCLMIFTSLLRFAASFKRKQSGPVVHYEWVDPYEGLNTENYDYHRHVYRVGLLDQESD